MKISQNLGQSKHDSSFTKWKIFCHINPQFWPHFIKSPKASWQKKKKRHMANITATQSWSTTSSSCGW